LAVSPIVNYRSLKRQPPWPSDDVMAELTRWAPLAHEVHMLPRKRPIKIFEVVPAEEAKKLFTRRRHPSNI